MINRMVKTAMLFTTPRCPITTLAGDAERELAIFITLGARNDEPKPATVKVMHKTTNESILLSGPINLTVKIPIKNEVAETIEPNFIRN